MYMSISVSAYIDRETVRARDISGAEVCYAHTCNEGTHTMRGHGCNVLISKKNYRIQRTANAQCGGSGFSLALENKKIGALRPGVGSELGPPLQGPAGR